MNSQEQYRTGIDKLWHALGINSAQKEDVFTLAARAIEDAKGGLFYEKYHKVAGRLAAALDIDGPTGVVDIFTQAVDAIKNAKTLKTFRIKVIRTDGTSGVRLIHAFNETDARAIAYYGAKGTISLADLEVAKQWTVVLQENAEEELAKLKLEHATLREKMAMVKPHLARLLRCQGKYGPLKKVLLSVCRCGRYTVDEIYPHHVERIEVETLQEARDIYLNIFDTLREFHWNNTVRSFPLQEGFNFVVLSGIFLCKEHKNE